mmetsp:Transcript_6482/g.9967  ORF Transcript_6482/g.9967 Transcript_6482/m.9967 type:complete len:300 (+) Transcript_6482:53-952(+)
MSRKRESTPKERSAKRSRRSQQREYSLDSSEIEALADSKDKGYTSFLDLNSLKTENQNLKITLEKLRKENESLKTENQNMKGIMKERSEEGNMFLINAARKGKFEVMETMLTLGFDVNTNIRSREELDYNMYTPLHYAVQRDDYWDMRLLCKNKADTEAKCKWGCTPLHVASRDDRLSTVSGLIKYNANIESRAGCGGTPLHYASGRGHLKVAKCLVENMANLLAKDGSGSSPLHSASRAGTLDIVTFLVGKKAIVDAKNNKGFTPLHHASHYGKLDVVKFLLREKADIEAKTPMQKIL